MRHAEGTRLLTIIVGLILAMTLGLVSLVGCGTVSVNLHTTVKPSGDISQEIKVGGSGMSTHDYQSKSVRNI